MPCTVGSEFARETSESSASGEIVAGSRTVSAWIPASCAARVFAPTYDCDAGLSPTRITRSPGGESRRAAPVASATRWRTVRATAVPSRTTAVDASELIFREYPIGSLRPGRGGLLARAPVARRQREADDARRRRGNGGGAEVELDETVEREREERAHA